MSTGQKTILNLEIKRNSNIMERIVGYCSLELDSVVPRKLTANSLNHPIRTNRLSIPLHTKVVQNTTNTKEGI